MNNRAGAPRPVVLGAGFTGLSAAYELARRGLRPTVIEADLDVGGLAGTFPTGGARLEKFYHHWFTSDAHLMALLLDLGLEGDLVVNPVNTGLYHANALFRLSSPLDLLRFRALSPVARIRLGSLPLLARAYRSWEQLDDVSAAVWLRRVCGNEAYRVVWEPLLRGKFGDHADSVSAAWFWSKLRLRGNSRDKVGHERLAYLKGGFGAVLARLTAAITAAGGRVLLGRPASALHVNSGRIAGVTAGGERVDADGVIVATPLPVAADLLRGIVPEAELARLRQIRFLANRCVVLELERSLSGLYWINVNDPSFPFVGIVEHTNFAAAADYGGSHVVYLSRYCSSEDPFLDMDLAEATNYAVASLRRMFADFTPAIVRRSHSWQSRWAQPVVSCGYRRLIPPHRTPVDGLYLATMAQIYPEDRGTNYAVRDGREVATMLAAELSVRS